MSTLISGNLLTLDSQSFDSTVGDWGEDSNCTPTRSTGAYYDAPASMFLSATANGDMSANIGGVSITQNVSYTFSFRTINLGTARSVLAILNWFDDSFNLLGQSFGDTYTNTSNWADTQPFVTDNAPSGATLAFPVIYVIGANQGETHYFDFCCLRTSSTLPTTAVSATVTPAVLSMALNVRGVSVTAGADSLVHGDVVAFGMTVNAATALTPSASATVTPGVVALGLTVPHIGTVTSRLYPDAVDLAASFEGLAPLVGQHGGFDSDLDFDAGISFDYLTPQITGLVFFPPTGDVGAPVDPRERRTNPLGARLDDWFVHVNRGRNVFKLTNGTITEDQPTFWEDVAEVWYGGHYTPVSAEDAALLEAAGYGPYLLPA